MLHLHRYVIQEADGPGFLVGTEEFVEMPGIAPAPFFAWRAVEGTWKHVLTWLEAETHIRHQKDASLRASFDSGASLAQRVYEMSTDSSIPDDDFRETVGRMARAVTRRMGT